MALSLQTSFIIEGIACKLKNSASRQLTSKQAIPKGKDEFFKSRTNLRNSFIRLKLRTNVEANRKQNKTLNPPALLITSALREEKKFVLKGKKLILNTSLPNTTVRRRFITAESKETIFNKKVTVYKSDQKKKLTTTLLTFPSKRTLQLEPSFRKSK